MSKNKETTAIIKTVRKQVPDAEWEHRIVECQKSGLSTRKWCTINNIAPSSYYLHLRRIRENIIEENQIIQLPNVNASHSPVVIKSENISIELTENASHEQLRAVISALRSC